MHKCNILINKELFVNYVIKRSSCDNGLDLSSPCGNICKKKVHIGENKRYGMLPLRKEVIYSALGTGTANLLQKGMEETILLKVTIIHNSFIPIRENAESESIRGG